MVKELMNCSYQTIHYKIQTLALLIIRRIQINVDDRIDHIYRALILKQKRYCFKFQIFRQKSIFVF